MYIYTYTYIKRHIKQWHSPSAFIIICQSKALIYFLFKDCTWLCLGIAPRSVLRNHCWCCSVDYFQKWEIKLMSVLCKLNDLTCPIGCSTLDKVTGECFRSLEVFSYPTEKNSIVETPGSFSFFFYLFGPHAAMFMLTSTTLLRDHWGKGMGRGHLGWKNSTHFSCMQSKYPLY